MKKSFLFFLFIAALANSKAADSTKHKIEIGLEQDLLPYPTGGYFIAGWVGKGHVRARVLATRVNKPDFILQKGFTSNRVTSYAVLADFFLKENWAGWWIGGGAVYWKSSIENSSTLHKANFKNALLNGSIGYNWKLTPRWYIGPWAGLSARIAGDKHVVIDDKTFDPPFLNPEASLKIGYRF